MHFRMRTKFASLIIGALFLLIRCTFQITSNFTELFPLIETYRLDNFPPEKVALHMSCSESNIFATNCACHIKCSEPECKRAYQICEKYRIRFVVISLLTFQHHTGKLLRSIIYVDESNYLPYLT